MTVTATVLKVTVVAVAVAATVQRRLSMTPFHIQIFRLMLSVAHRLLYSLSLLPSFLPPLSFATEGTSTGTSQHPSEFCPSLRLDHQKHEEVPDAYSAVGWEIDTTSEFGKSRCHLSS